MRIQSEKRSLPTELSPEDLAKESQALADAVEEVKKQKAYIVERTATWKDEKKKMDGHLAHLEDEMNALATVVDTGVADREVECSWLYSLTKGYAFLVRDDTGELVLHRKLGDQERQESMLEVLREPTEEQLAAWTESLGLVIDPQGDLPLAGPGGSVYFKRILIPDPDGGETTIGRFSEADHRPSSLTGIHLVDAEEEADSDPSELEYDDDPGTLRTYRQALEALLEAKRADSVREERGEPGEDDEPPAPTPIGRVRKGAR